MRLILRSFAPHKFASLFHHVFEMLRFSFQTTLAFEQTTGYGPGPARAPTHSQSPPILGSTSLEDIELA